MWKIATLFFLFSAFLSVAQEPQLKGGIADFIKQHTIYPAYAMHNCIQGTIHIGFKLNQKGEVYYSTVTKGLGIDLDEEALRLIRMTTGKWEVPITHDTLATLIVPVNFTLRNSDCNLKTSQEITLAIAAYKNETELSNVVQNFYRNKENGVFKPEDEPKILRIKAELEIDEAYLMERIETGLKKYKQGDKQGACEDFNFVKYMGSDKANNWLAKYCK